MAPRTKRAPRPTVEQIQAALEQLPPEAQAEVYATGIARLTIGQQCDVYNFLRKTPGSVFQVVDEFLTFSNDTKQKLQDKLRRRRNEERDRQAAELKAAGLTDECIALKLKCSVDAIRQSRHRRKKRA